MDAVKLPERRTQMLKRRTMLAAVAAEALLACAQPSFAQSTSVSPTKAKTHGETAMNHPIKSSTLKVPGASIYYEVQGAGPLLLIIPGGAQDAGVFADLSQQLADRYTVVAFDPRGNSRSAFDGEPEELQLDVQGDDAASLIRSLGSPPAYVFGTSGGAQIGLNLAARHPELVRALVAHEPPAVTMLDDPSQALAADRDIYDTYRRDGVDAAMHKFFTGNSLDDAAEQDATPPEFAATPEAAETFMRVSGNFEYWLAHGLMPLSLYRPDVNALRSGKPRVTVAIGEQSAGLPIYDISMAVAKRLGSDPVLFPGDHIGFGPNAEAFAEALHGEFAGK
jgi:pimeloyl-ACP methyl ester carboxylesterase